MKFETLRLMAQDYADRHKEPPPLPATIDTMAYAYQRICQGEDPWTALGDFSNAWYSYAKHIRPDLVKDPLIKPEQETESTRRWGAFCAASVEYLCDLHHQPCPEWVHDPSYMLDTPWWYTQRETIQRSENTRTEPCAFVSLNLETKAHLFRSYQRHHLRVKFSTCYVCHAACQEKQTSGLHDYSINWRLISNAHIGDCRL